MRRMSERTEQPTRDEAPGESGMTVQGQVLAAGVLIPASVLIATTGRSAPPMVIALAVTLFMFGAAALLTAVIATGIRLGNRT